MYSIIIPFQLESNLKNNDTKLDPNFIAGFTVADGCFTLTKPSASGPYLHTFFLIHQNIRYNNLMERMIDLIGCGKVYVSSDGMCNLAVRDKKNLSKLVVSPFSLFTP